MGDGISERLATFACAAGNASLVLYSLIVLTAVVLADPANAEHRVIWNELLVAGDLILAGRPQDVLHLFEKSLWFMIGQYELLGGILIVNREHVADGATAELLCDVLLQHPDDILQIEVCNGGPGAMQCNTRDTP